MNNEFGSALWDVKGIPNVGREYIKDVKPQGFTFSSSYNFTEIDPVNHMELLLSATANSFILPYNSLLVGFGVAAIWTEPVDSKILAVNPSNIYVELYASQILTPEVSWQQDNLATLGTYSADWQDFRQIGFSGNDGYKDLSEFGFIARRLNGRIIVSQLNGNPTDTSPGTIRLVLQLRFKRA